MIDQEGMVELINDMAEWEPSMKQLKTMIYPTCPHCGEMHELDSNEEGRSWGKLQCKFCKKLFKYAKQEIYITEKIARDTPRNQQ